jgi:hypothetical protein
MIGENAVLASEPTGEAGRKLSVHPNMKRLNR